MVRVGDSGCLLSGHGMSLEFNILECDGRDTPPYPNLHRRADWRSSGAKRLMPQLQTKVPILRQCETKMAVAIDVNFFEAIGRVSSNPSHDIDAGDVIWLVIGMSDEHSLEVQNWEMWSLEDSITKLVASEKISRHEFEKILCTRLQPLDRARRI